MDFFFSITDVISEVEVDESYDFNSVGQCESTIALKLHETSPNSDELEVVEIYNDEDEQEHIELYKLSDEEQKKILHKLKDNKLIGDMFVGTKISMDFVNQIHSKYSNSIVKLRGYVFDKVIPLNFKSTLSIFKTASDNFESDVAIAKDECCSNVDNKVKIFMEKIKMANY